MLSKREIEKEVKKLMKEKEHLTIEEFANKADMFFENFEVTSRMIKESINKGYIPYHEQKEIVPTEELLEFNPNSFLSIKEFAKRTGLNEKRVTELIEEEQIKTLNFSDQKIHIKEFRNYAKRNDIETIHKLEELYQMLDDYFRSSSWWNDFFSNRERAVPFFVDVPDENLVSYIEKEIIEPKKVLELGCGNGRNAIFLAKQGCQVDAVDSSEEAINWAKENAEKAGVEVNFICKSIFDLNFKEREYDLVYDSGCFHHIPPHRRFSYLTLLKKALKSKKYFGLNCFNSKMGADYTDWEVYEKGSLSGGLSYSKRKIKNIFTDLFQIVRFRKMKDVKEEKALFSKSFMWSILFKKKDV